jgi:hypothetical protein
VRFRQRQFRLYDNVTWSAHALRARALRTRKVRVVLFDRNMLSLFASRRYHVTSVSGGYVFVHELNASRRWLSVGVAQKSICRFAVET